MVIEANRVAQPFASGAASRSSLGARRYRARDKEWFRLASLRLDARPVLIIWPHLPKLDLDRSRSSSADELEKASKPHDKITNFTSGLSIDLAQLGVEQRDDVVGVPAVAKRRAKESMSKPVTNRLVQGGGELGDQRRRSAGHRERAQRARFDVWQSGSRSVNHHNTPASTSLRAGVRAL